MNDKLDPRVNAYRTDLADIRLKDRVRAQRYSKGENLRICVAKAPLLDKPQEKARQIHQALFGEIVHLFERHDGWAWIQLSSDNYVGYIREDATGPVGGNGHGNSGKLVDIASAPLFTEPDPKARSYKSLFMGSIIKTGEQIDGFVKVDDPVYAGHWIYEKHLRDPTSNPADMVMVAEKFISAPYLWGGITIDGIDCSGLVQIAARLAGHPCPRDSDMQRIAIGGHDANKINRTPNRGELIFWPGHVGIMYDSENLLHANAFHMAVTIEPLDEVIDRIARESDKK